MKHGPTTTATHPRTLLVGIHAPYNLTKDIQSYYDEFINLVISNGLEYDDNLLY